jgi:hypothetical protein
MMVRDPGGSGKHRLDVWRLRFVVFFLVRQACWNAGEIVRPPRKLMSESIIGTEAVEYPKGDIEGCKKS